MTKKTQPATLERCHHSLRDYTVDPISGEEIWFNRACVLVAHTAEDSHGRPLHQDDRGRTWS